MNDNARSQYTPLPASLVSPNIAAKQGGTTKPRTMNLASRSSIFHDVKTPNYRQSRVRQERGGSGYSTHLETANSVQGNGITLLDA